ncbi:MAG: DNA gyrase subunit A [Bacillota bacterium]
MSEIMEEKIIPVNIADEMKKSFLDYAMSVIVSRALPDVRDGLKPVHRRILYGMYESGTTPDKPYKKSARIVGDVMGRYHPHGDAAIYDSMVRMAQDFSIRCLLVDGHGNFGSVDGDPPAAMRYTEVRLSKLAMELLSDIDKETVDFMPNFDESLEEPKVLPGRFPNLLVNGSSGIAVGMATNIPPHNLGEVIDGVVQLIDKPDITIKELMQVIKGPDFPTGAVILGRDGIRNAYETGRGSIRIRAKVEIESISGGKSRLVVTELPYLVNKAKLVEQIANLTREKVVDGITDLRDESDRKGMRVVIDLRRDVNPHVVLNQLYKHTPLQDTFGVIMLVLVNNQPRILNIKEVLIHYLAHQKEVVTRRTKFDLGKAEAKAHILEGLRIALDHIDEVISLIRASRTVEAARDGLMGKFGLSEKQAQAILDMRLQRLTGLEREKIEEEYGETLKLIACYRDILASEAKLMGIIKEELLHIKDGFKDGRRTEITKADDSQIEAEDLIVESEIVVTITHAGYIKRLPLSTYKSQRRGGRGIAGMSTREEDFLEHLFTCSTHDVILFFTNKGQVYHLKGFEIPEAGRQARGTAIINLLQIEPGERVTAFIKIKDYEPDKFIFMATRHGVVKKTALSEYQTQRKGGLIGISLDDDDELIGALLTNGKRDVFLVTKLGLAIRFPEEMVRSMGRTARGVKGIALVFGDEVVAMDKIKDGKNLLILTELGYGKFTPVEEYRRQSRGGKGLKTAKITVKNGPIAAAKIVMPESELMVITAQGVIIRMKVSDISVQGRATQGVRVMKLDEGDKIVALANVVTKEDEPEKTEEEI